MSHKLAHLPKDVLATLEHEESMYNVGWSYGKEKLGDKPDFGKGSFYANPLVCHPLHRETPVEVGVSRGWQLCSPLLCWCTWRCSNQAAVSCVTRRLPCLGAGRRACARCACNCGFPPSGIVCERCRLLCVRLWQYDEAGSQMLRKKYPFFYPKNIWPEKAMPEVRRCAISPSRHLLMLDLCAHRLVCDCVYLTCVSDSVRACSRV
jgi:hypothetical protein